MPIPHPLHALCLAALLPALLVGAEKPKGRGEAMDYGPFLTCTATAAASGQHPAQAVPKGLCVRIGAERQATICYDTDLLRPALAWHGFLDLAGTNIGTYKGDGVGVPVSGNIAFATRPGPGWGTGDGFPDQRPGAGGPLPRAQAHYRGLFLHGERVILDYTVGTAAILESPGLAGGALPVFTRSLQVRSATPLSLVLCDLAPAPAPAPDAPPAPGAPAGALTAGRAPAAGAIAVLGAGTLTAAACLGAPTGATIEVLDATRIVVHLPPTPAGATLTIALWNGAAADHQAFAAALATLPAAPDLAALCTGGPARWQPVTTRGTRGGDGGPFAVDTLALPEDNPAQAWLRPSGLDFLPDGRLVVCTLNGDVWIASGVDAELATLTWRRFASGLFEPLGVRVAAGAIHVTGRDQITRLHDLDGDGEADRYENFNNDRTVFTSYHAFAFDLQTDAQGNFYYAVGGNQVPPEHPHHDRIFRLPPDGSRLEAVASGFRAPNGISVGPDGAITCSDNQGHWTPASKLMMVKPGAWHGFVNDPRRGKSTRAHGDDWQPPLCWIPQSADNSSGGQVWVEGQRWGPFSGRLLHTSYGTCSLFLVLAEQVGGLHQGGVVRLPLTFASGVMRGRFNPVDGQLYLAGLKGWQTNAPRDGTLARVRWTGKPANLPTALSAGRAGLTIAFTDPMDAASLGDPGNYAIEQWNYRWSSAYGSDDYRPSDPLQKGRDRLEVSAARPAADGRSVVLEIPGLAPVMQMRIKLKLLAADGSAVSHEICNTIHRLE